MSGEEITTVLPWQHQPWRALLQARRDDRLPHALLLGGPAGVGKGRFARALAHALLCDAPDAEGHACGTCRSCRLLASGAHPDLLTVAPEEKKRAITVDQIRAVGHYFSLTSQYGGHKIVIIEPAEAMNVNAANSLLKTLEEPTPGSLLLLVSHRPAQLPATVRSRCQSFRFGRVEAEAALPWLKERLGAEQDPALLLALADGAPLKVLALADKGVVALRRELFSALERLAARENDPVSVADQWVKKEIESTLYWMYSWMTDLVRLKAAGDAAPLANTDMAAELARLGRRATLRGLLELQERLVEAMRQIELNLNPQLVVEDLLIRWSHCFSQGSTR